MPDTLLTLPPSALRTGDNIRTDLGDLKELVASIRSSGLLEPLVVRPLFEQGEIPNQWEVDPEPTA